MKIWTRVITTVDYKSLIVDEKSSKIDQNSDDIIEGYFIRKIPS
jgi:hypothetical protein